MCNLRKTARRAAHDSGKASLGALKRAGLVSTTGGTGMADAKTEVDKVDARDAASVKNTAGTK